MANNALQVCLNTWQEVKNSKIPSVMNAASVAQQNLPLQKQANTGEMVLNFSLKTNDMSRSIVKSKIYETCVCICIERDRDRDREMYS